MKFTKIAKASNGISFFIAYIITADLNFPLDKQKICAIIQKLFDSATEYGGIAQLGERLNGIQEVSGSIPLISTNPGL